MFDITLHVFYLNISDAFESSKMLCDQYYLTSPELKLTQVNGKMRAFMSVFLLVAKLLLLLNQKAPNSIAITVHTS